MLYRLVRPMKRKGSSKHQFVQRIPADVKGFAAGTKLEVPVGEEIVSVTIAPKAEAVRLSLRTSSPPEVKQRQAQVAAYLETVWQAMRNDEPLPLSHRQVVALAGEIYRGWADPSRLSAMSIQFMPDGSSIIERDVDALHDLDQGEPLGNHWVATAGENGLQRLMSAKEISDPHELEPVFGPAIDRLLAAKSILRVTSTSRAMLLRECLRAFQDGEANQKRNASGDYSPDPGLTP